MYHGIKAANGTSWSPIPDVRDNQKNALLDFKTILGSNKPCFAKCEARPPI